MASHPTPMYRAGSAQTASNAFWMIATLLLSVAVAVVGFSALML